MVRVWFSVGRGRLTSVMKKYTPNTPPKGWHCFALDYRMDDGSRWSIDIIAQSEEDAETRLRCIKENGAVDGRIIGEVEA